jgi:hypothetical protein
MARAPLLVAAGLLAQAALLVPLAGTHPSGAAVLAAGAALAAAVAATAWARLRPRARASLAMLAAGGCGMTLGWWADLGFASAAEALRAAPEAAAWCGLAPRGDHALPGAAHLLSWMNGGMLAAGALGMRLAGARAIAACGGALARGADALAMVAGMSAGAALATSLAGAVPAEAAVVGAHALMNAGMLAGMQLAALARIAARALAIVPSPNLLPPGPGAL